jgi:hypothetical protein
MRVRSASCDACWDRRRSGDAGSRGPRRRAFGTPGRFSA